MNLHQNKDNPNISRDTQRMFFATKLSDEVGLCLSRKSALVSVLNISLKSHLCVQASDFKHLEYWDSFSMSACRRGR